MKQQSTTKGFAILSAAGMLVKLLSLLYLPFLLHILGGDEGFGIYYTAYQIYVFVYVLTNSGIPVAISKLISELTALKNYKDAVKSFKLARFILLIVGTIMTLLTLVLAGPFSSIWHSSRSYYAIIALAPAIFFTSIASAYRGYFQGRGNMTPTAVSQVIEQAINTITTLLFAALFMKYGLDAACAGGALGTTLGALFSAAYLLVYYEKNKRFIVPKGYRSEDQIIYSTKQLVKRILHYGLPITICVGMTYAGNLVDLFNTKDRLLATGIFNRNAVEALYGTLGKYQQLINVPITVISALSAAILPAIASAAILKDKLQVKNQINYAFRLCLLIAVPSAVGLAVLSKPVFLFVFSSRYINGYKLMMMGSAVIILTSLVQIQTTILQGMGKLYTATFYSFAGIVMKIIANYILIAIPSVNIYGAVFGSMLGFLTTLYLNHRMMTKTLKVRIGLLSQIIKPLTSSAIMGIAVSVSYVNIYNILAFVHGKYVENAAATLISVLIGVYVYLFALILTGGISHKDLEVMPAKVKRFIPKRMLMRIR